MFLLQAPSLGRLGLGEPQLLAAAAQRNAQLCRKAYHVQQISSPTRNEFNRSPLVDACGLFAPMANSWGRALAVGVAGAVGGDWAEPLYQSERKVFRIQPPEQTTNESLDSPTAQGAESSSS